MGGARRVERIDADIALPLDVTDEESCRRVRRPRGRGARRASTSSSTTRGSRSAAIRSRSRRSRTRRPSCTRTSTARIRITRLALPHVSDEGHILFTGSIAGRQAYPNAASYVAAKFALRGFVYGLREDLLGRPIRITTVDPGLVETEFSLVRYRGDEEAAKARVRRASTRSRADDVADCVLFALTRPLHVNVDEIVIKALAQSSGGRIVRRRELSRVLTILEGSTFCICDDRGDIGAETSGLLRPRHAVPLAARPARRRRRAAAALVRPGRALRGGLLPAQRAATAFRATRSRSPASASSARGCRSGSRVRNESMERLDFEVALEVGRRLRGHHLREAARLRARRPGARAAAAAAGAAIAYDENARGSSRSSIRAATSRTRVVLSEPGAPRRRRACRSTLALEPHERWELTVDVLPSLDGRRARPSRTSTRRARPPSDVVAAWTLRVPKLRGGWESLRRSFDRSIADLAALRMRTGENRRPLFAAGMPWFMTVFGRDTAITSLQTLLLGPEIAVGALDALTELQAQEEDPDDRRRAREDRPRGARGPLRRVLVPALLRLDRLDAALPRAPRGDLALDGRRGARAAAARAGAAARSSGSTATATATATASSSTAGRRSMGLANQSWKDSGDSQRFHDGSFADAADRSRSRCRDTSTTRSAGSPRSRARRGATQSSRTGSSSEADELRARFDEAFWVEDRGGFYALALDGEKRPVDARCSNMGHLLWSGIVPPDRVDAVADQLLSESLWSGWGIRTMASDEAAFNPISYHNGTVWPHDSALAAWGLARHGYASRGTPRRARADRGRGPLRLVAAGGLRRLRAPGDAVPDRLPDGRPPAGLGGRHAHPPRPRAARRRARPRAPAARLDGRGRAAELARRAARRGHPRVRPHLDGCRRARACHDCGGSDRCE